MGAATVRAAPLVALGAALVLLGVVMALEPLRAVWGSEFARVAIGLFALIPLGLILIGATVGSLIVRYLGQE